MAHRLLALLLLGLGAGYLHQAANIPLDPWTAAEAVNTRTLPLLYGALLCAVSLLLLARRPAAATVRFDGYRLLRLAGVLVGVLAFVVALPFVSLWLALGALLAALPLWLGERRPGPVLLLAAAMPALGWLGIEVLLGLYLPD